jgi:hypothetical protein
VLNGKVLVLPGGLSLSKNGITLDNLRKVVRNWCGVHCLLPCCGFVVPGL